jgi:hypothetical protein
VLEVELVEVLVLVDEELEPDELATPLEDELEVDEELELELDEELEELVEPVELEELELAPC